VLDDIEQLDIDGLREALSGRVVGSRLFYHALLASTMDETRRLADEGVPEGAVVFAEEQTAGRGRFNRVWVSPPGLNLSFSVLFRPDKQKLPYINMAAALAVCDAASELTGLTTTIKWPNDVRIDGKKLSGILVETDVVGNEIDHAVVGIGVNVNLDAGQYPEIASIATSLMSASGRRFDRSVALRLVLEHLDRYYERVRSGGSLTTEWASKLDTLGKVVKVRWREQVLEGTAETVDDQGNLVLRKSDGTTVNVVAGEVTLQV
jgi:BirA family biotin operon repressor/biotin-[acetyl-CoA-carboxylase] ligase